MILYWLVLAVVSSPQASSCTCQHTITRSVKRRHRKWPDTVRRDGKATTRSESQRRKGKSSACLDWVHNLSCTAGGHLKEMKEGQDPTGAAKIIHCFYGRMWKKRGISLLVISRNGDIITPCISKALWIRKTDVHCYKIPYVPFLGLGWIFWGWG